MSSKARQIHMFTNEKHPFNLLKKIFTFPRMSISIILSPENNHLDYPNSRIHLDDPKTEFSLKNSSKPLVRCPRCCCCLALCKRWGQSCRRAELIAACVRSTSDMHCDVGWICQMAVGWLSDGYVGWTSTVHDGFPSRATSPAVWSEGAHLHT